MIFFKWGSHLVILINGKINTFTNDDIGYGEMARAWIEWRGVK